MISPSKYGSEDIRKFMTFKNMDNYVLGKNPIEEKKVHYVQTTLDIYKNVYKDLK